MIKHLIPDTLQSLLRSASVGTFAETEARVRQQMAVRPSYRLLPSYEAFYDPGTMTIEEIDTFEAAELEAALNTVSLQTDVLTMLAVIVRAKNPAAWDALTASKKMAAVRAEARIWKTVREFI